MRIGKKIFFLGGIFFVGLIAIGYGAGYLTFRGLSDKAPANISATQTETDPYRAWLAEVFDKVKTNYWEKTTDEQLSNLYKLATAKVAKKDATEINLTTADLTGVQKLIAEQTKDLADDKKKEFIAGVTDVVLANLKPFGRSRLYSAKQEKELRDTVSNVDTSTDLYAALGVSKDASEKDITTAYQAQSEKLQADKSPEAAQKLALVQRAYAALAKPENKKQYDQTKFEPTVIYHFITPDIFYLHLTKFSPQSFDELQAAANSVKTSPTTLIFDLRGNVGGAIDILQYFLGPFIGPDQYAYEFFHQDEKTPYKTKVGWLESLVRYKKIVILTDNQMQSSAEVMAATLKKYNVGVLVGTTTKGWGTVEQLIPMEKQLSPDEKYTLLLVHSLTLREDGQPIEGKGVDPAINITNKNWPKELSAHFNYPELITAVKNLLK